MDDSNDDSLNNFFNNIDFTKFDLRNRRSRALLFGLIGVMVGTEALAVAEQCAAEEFGDEINERDDGRCIICGEVGSEQSALDCTHIVPKDEKPAVSFFISFIFMLYQHTHSGRTCSLKVSSLNP
jgi:hypothetical protein